MEARQRALKVVRSYTDKQRQERAVKKEEEQPKENTKKGAKNQGKALDAEKTLHQDSSISNRLIEQSLIAKEESAIFSTSPVRSFKANGNEVKSLHIVADTSGKVSLYDMGANLIIDATLNSTIIS